jgi:predicted phosphodiesterase
MKQTLKIVKAPSKLSSALVLPDLHIPKEDAHAIYLAEQYGKENKVDTIVLLGDVLDNTAFSRFKKKPEEEKVKSVFDKAKDRLSLLRSKFPKARIYWTEGNHDLWYDNYITQNCKALKDDPYYSMQARLDLDKLDIHYLPETSILQFHDYFLHHGHLFFRGKYSGQIPAKAGFEQVLDNIIFGHVHRLSQWQKKTLRGTQKNGYSLGCLSALSPNYSPFANYQHGIGHLFRKGNKSVFRNILIEKEILF